MASMFQDFVDGENARAQRQRAGQQMTLGGLIDALAQLPPDRAIAGLCEPHSYRGYYCDVAFEPSDEARSVADVLAEARGCMGEIFIGYKGGDYTMGRNTPVWISLYGMASGMRLMGLDVEADPIRSVTAEEDHA